MWYEKEYAFLKKIALRLQFPIRELTEKDLSILYEKDFSISKTSNKGNFENIDWVDYKNLLKNSDEKKLFYLENPIEDVNCLYMTIPSVPHNKRIILGPFRKKEFYVAHGLMAEFAESVWKEPCRTQKYSVDIQKKHPLIEAVVRKIDDDIMGNHTLRHMAKQMHVSPGHLSKLFTQEMGMSLTEYVNRKKVTYGAYLLTTTEDKISVIAGMCGIKDNNYFSRLFRRYYGMSPASYRKIK